MTKVDKNEYSLKLQEIDQLVDQGNYEQAAALADQIDWRRVRNVRTLCLISEIYEAQDRYEDSKALLVRAYRRSPVGRAILYRLVEVTIKLKQFDEAIDYYSAYVQAAPNDTSKYILKYKIYRGRGSSVDEQIEILKEYLDQEYNEKYAYELAKLYQEADRIQECLATCDDLVLWFHSGKYVIKALELKQKYASLTPKQQEIYNHRFDQDEDELFGREKEMVETDEASLAQEIVDDTSKEIADAIAAVQAQESDAEPEEETGEPDVQERGEDADEDDIGDVMESFDSTAAAEEPEAGMSALEENQPDLSETQIFPEIRRAPVADAQGLAPEPDMPSDEALDEPVPDPKAFDEQLNKYNTQELQTEMIKSMREVISGVGIREMIDENEEAVDRVIEQSKAAQDQAAAREETFNMTRTLAKPRLQKKRDAGQLSIDDILLSMGQEGSSVRETAMKASQTQTSSGRTQPAGVLSAVDEALLNMGIDPQPQPYREKPLDELFKKDEDAAPAEETLQEEPVQAAETVQEEAVQAAEAVMEEASQGAEAVQDEAVQAAETLYAETEDGEVPAAGLWDEEVPDEEVLHEEAGEDEAAAEFPGREGPDEEVLCEEAGEDEAAAELPDEEIPGEEAPGEEAGEEEAAAAEFPDEESPDEDIPQAAARGGEAGDEDVRIAGAPVHKQEAGGERAGEGETAENTKTGDAKQDMTMDEIINAQTRKIPSDKILEHENKAKGQQPGMGAQEKHYLKPSLRGLFEGYLEIPDLEKQIAGAIQQALAKGADRTSRSGNVLIFGGHGCGKTTIATGLAKAIAQERGSRSVKMAKIYATDLNRKDIAATIAKISGGILIVEEAGDLEDGIADQLTTAMEFRTDGLILILEDEQRYMHDLLMRHPRMTMKFTSQIYIPRFTIDNLVNFGAIYADDHDYVLSDGAAATLGSKLTALSGEGGEALSITSSLDLVDKAIVRANKFGRKLFSGRKRFDEEGRVVLLEKDFR